ncbi:MAG: PhoX family phosphatase, partial [Pirellulales bacterium]
MTDRFLHSAENRRFTRAVEYELSEDVARNPSDNPTFGDMVQRRFSRRTFLQGGLAVTAATGLLAAAAPSWSSESSVVDSNRTGGGRRFDFEELEHGVDARHRVAAGHEAQILIRWGDPVLPNAPAWDPHRQSAAAQEMQFGYNNDYIGYLPFDKENPNHGLMLVNHEYTNEELMFPGLGRYDDEFSNATAELVGIEMAAHGASVLEIEREANGSWRIVPDAKYARRITARKTEMRLSGPAAGSPRLRTSVDAEGKRVIGMLNNCAGGMTPWGTFLTCEENFHGYFLGRLPAGHSEADNHARYGVPGGWYAWGKFHRRFDVAQEPQEANRFGWVVEIDPFDPESTPVKRTALGRFKHEGAETILNSDGRVVVFMGDDERFEYVYRFVTADRYEPKDPQHNRNLLDRGTLSVAQFHEDGSLDWLPLVFGQGPLTAKNGFASQADVVIDARRAADLLGATKMDRPEDVEPNPRTGKIYVMLTNNDKRTVENVNPANDRTENLWGHIVELQPPQGNYAAPRFQWEILIKAGRPGAPQVAALWNPATSEHGWFACPDNCAVDPQGRLWVSTDQGSNWRQASGTADGLWALETEGEQRGTGIMFFRCPVGAELCGPLFTPDGKTLFLAVQHPAADGTEQWQPFGRASTFGDPATRWPDFDPGIPPRPSVVAIRREDGG